MVNNLKDDKCSLSEDDEDKILTKKEEQKIKLLKNRNRVKMNDTVMHYLITKNNEHLSSTGVSGKVPVLLIFPLMVLIFLLLMIYL